VKERKEGGSKQHQDKGTPNKEEGSKERSCSAVSRLDSKKGGDIPKVEAHTEQGPDNKAYLGGTPRPRLLRQTVIFMVTCLLVGN